MLDLLHFNHIIYSYPFINRIRFILIHGDSFVIGGGHEERCHGYGLLGIFWGLLVLGIERMMGFLLVDIRIHEVIIHCL